MVIFEAAASKNGFAGVPPDSVTNLFAWLVQEIRPNGGKKKVVVFHIGLQILILHAVGLQIRPNGQIC
jgi:hypothetical protein